MKRAGTMPDTLHDSTPYRLSEVSTFYLKSAAFLACMGILLYMGLAAKYPPIHDAMHSVRHALAIVPCH